MLNITLVYILSGVDYIEFFIFSCRVTIYKKLLVY